MVKNLYFKKRTKENPYEIWKTPDGLWEWRVLRKYQVDDNKPHARWFVAAKSPFTQGGFEYGDTYASDIKQYAIKQKMKMPKPKPKFLSNEWKKNELKRIRATQKAGLPLSGMDSWILDTYHEKKPKPMKPKLPKPAKVKKPKQSSLVLKGKKQYVQRMYKHLRKEHPSTKRKMSCLECGKLSKKRVR